MGLLCVDKAKAKDVQGCILRYAQDNDLMAVNWSDNGGPYVNTLADAIANAFDIKLRRIPTGHPQSSSAFKMKFLLSQPLEDSLSSTFFTCRKAMGSK